MKVGDRRLYVGILDDRTELTISKELTEVGRPLTDVQRMTMPTVTFIGHARSFKITWVGI
jgi:hypothetical protein